MIGSKDIIIIIKIIVHSHEITKMKMVLLFGVQKISVSLKGYKLLTGKLLLNYFNFFLDCFLHFS